VAAIAAAEKAIVAAMETAAVVAAAMVAMAAPTAAKAAADAAAAEVECDMQQRLCLKKVQHKHIIGFLQFQVATKAMIQRLCFCRILFVVQIKVPRKTFICATNRISQIHK
jgi:hypothetical protein